MIDLFRIKQYNTFDYIQDSLPDNDGTWLCSLTSVSYTRGYSYNVASGVATRFDEPKDNLMLGKIYPTLETTCETINNWFYVKRDTDLCDYYQDYLSDYFYYEADQDEYTFNGLDIENVSEDIFIVDDFIQVRNTKRNNVMAMVTGISGTTLTVDNTSLRNTTEDGYIFLCSLPEQFQDVIAQMINYDVNYRGIPSDKQSESIGNYSYTIKENSTINGLTYPSEYTSVLSTYRKVKFLA